MGSLNAASVRALLSTRSLARELELHEVIDSTNDRAKALASSGALHGTCVVATAQTAGRGRLGRSWWSPPGAGLYVSFVLRPQIAAREAPLLTLLCAVALQDALQEAEGVDAGIKWPNDLLAPRAGPARRKLAGILLEANTAGSSITFAVAGIGVNLREVERPPEIAALATSLDDLERGGTEAILAAWRTRALGAGEEVQLSTDQGVVRGVLEGVAPDGAVLIGGAGYYSGVLTLP